MFSKLPIFQTASSSSAGADQHLPAADRAQAAATDAFFVFLMVQFIRGLPKSSTRRPASTAAPFPDLREHHPPDDADVATTTIFTFIWT
jgi:hypothetical protein